MNRTLILLAACVMAAIPAVLSAQPFYYVGPAGGDFFDQANWNDSADGLGAFLATPVIDGGTGAIELAFIVDGDTVSAGADVDFGMGSLTLGPGASLGVGSGGLVFGSGSSFIMDQASLAVDAGGSGQIAFNGGSSISLSGSSVTASDDIFFRGELTIAGSMIESTGDDIEFQSSAMVVSINDSDFLASSTGSGGGFDQVIYFRTSTDAVFGSTFRGGRFGVLTDGVGTTTLFEATDSIFEFDGDVENIFASSNGGVHQFSLLGDSRLVADQLQSGIALFLGGNSTATFTDDLDDADGDSWLTDNALVRLDSTGASLTFANDQTADTRSRIFNGLAPTTYALDPSGFSPNDWDGVSAVTLRLVPEPGSAVLAILGGLGLAAAGRRRAG
ncbi:hypothetical protein Pla123a_19450 [Posidoniimonas polymericola]|uniref:PEP-CTERM protein-sorting domain-containing protein n=1 Tax=Posidoniimonas polymericola TaxID=2528002 RepID=A0A5C5YR38_9BACT|nr:hypothetical protein [Posidoniimonas polymericola]TWT77288.1 hypothetical protein Pla123a_19450 [Posidoniimonas polymericola]